MNKRSLNKKTKLYSSKGIRYFRQGKTESALKYLSKAIELNSKSYDVYSTRALIYEFDLNNLEYAIADYSKAIELAPNNFDAYFGRGNIYSKQEQYDLSIKDYTKVIKLSPQYFVAYIYRGKDYCYTKDFEKAEKDFLIALNLAQKNKHIHNIYVSYFNLGHFEFLQGNYTKAIPYYSKAIALKKEEPFFKIDSYLERGGCYMCTNNFEKAIPDFTSTIELAVNHSACSVYSNVLPESFYYRGCAYEAIGMKTKADFDFKKEKELSGKTN